MNRSTVILAFMLSMIAHGSVRAQEPAATTDRCFDRRPPSAQDVADDVARLFELTGALPLRSQVLHRGGAYRIRCSPPDGPLGSRWFDDDPAPDRAAFLLPIRLDTDLNSAYPRDFRNGVQWAGRGVSAALSGGIAFRYGVLSGAIAPVAAFAGNDEFDRPRANLPRYSPDVYPWHGGVIDWPLRPGDDAVAVLDPGQSHVRVDVGGFAAGVSTENLWWGPALFEPLMFSNTGPGFAHVFVGTNRPADVYIGTIEAQLLWGRLTESDHFDFDPDNDHRLIAAALLSFSPRGLPGLSLGASRSYMTTIPPGGFSLGDYVFKPYRSLRANSAIGQGTGDNQIVELFGRWAFPSAGFEVYAEWARDDQFEDLEDLIKEPDHSQVYTLGFQKVVERESGWLRLYGELSHLQASITALSLRGTSIFYTNTSVRQGYTQRGQLLGAPIGPGADAERIGGDWFWDRGRSGIYLERIRYDDDAYYANFARYYAFHGHDVELTAAVRQLLFLPHDLEARGEIAYSHRYNRNFTGLTGDFAQLFTTDNVQLRLGLTWSPAINRALP